MQRFFTNTTFVYFDVITFFIKRLTIRHSGTCLSRSTTKLIGLGIFGLFWCLFICSIQEGFQGFIVYKMAHV